MKNKKRVVRTVSLAVAATMSVGMFSFLAGCTTKKDALTIMTQDLNGLYNPFYSTAGTDMDVVGQTQISMFSTDSAGQIAYGDDEAVVVKDFMKEQVKDSTGAVKETVYTFVIKNGILFSDGVPLTMNDVLFNMYVYLDPAYTGSSTMYSTDIVGLQKYRQQQNVSGNGSEEESELTSATTNMAYLRRSELITAYDKANKSIWGNTASSYNVSEEQMLKFLETYVPTSGYKNTIAVDGNITDEAARKQLIEDYNTTRTLFREELERDYESAKDAYQSAPYKNMTVVGEDGKPHVEITNESSIDFSNEVVSFMYMEGYIKLAYARDPVTNEEDHNHIVESNGIETTTKNYTPSKLELKDKKKAREAAIGKVYEDKITSELHLILNYWATGNTLLNDYTGKAKEVYLHQILEDSSKLLYPSIEGIVSLGHNTQKTSITIARDDNGDGEIDYSKDYNIAQNHNEDGTPVNPDSEYDVLQIRINGTDPKAIWNFGFTVAPYHYYSDPTKYNVDIKNNEFGVQWGSFDFMKDTIQGISAKEYGSVRKNMIPLGAGPYVATNRKNADNPGDTEFYTDGIVYYKANKNFLLGEPKTAKMRYVVVSSSNALDRLKSGDVDFVEPQYTLSNWNTLTDLKSKGFKSVSSWQLGYGYIGVNAGKIPNINIRKAIMSAMNTELALQYYVGRQAENIAYPMSLVSWAYPRGNNAYNPDDYTEGMVKSNGKDYMSFTGDTNAIAKIENYMRAAGVSKGDAQLTIKFTIAGANTDHPCYSVFFHAAELLNSCGWNVTVEPDINALTKLATGSLAVWAAAWGSTIDPDMYQVYHKNSTATSVYSWGYREIRSQPTDYETETLIINSLSVLIDQARETDDQAVRTNLYKQAMDKVLELAVELPVYQRKTLYAFNANRIKLETLTIQYADDGSLAGNPYESPLSRLWEVELV